MAFIIFSPVIKCSLWLNILTLLYIYPVRCAPLSLVSGEVSNTESAENGQYPVDTVASFSCDSGYYQHGPNSVTCQTSGNWNEEAPRCEGF